MKIEFIKHFAIPSATPQQRKLGGKGTHPTEGLKVARATWQALLEKFAPVEPMTRPVRFSVTLYYHTAKGEFRPKTTRPDGDNLLKIIKDAATKAGWWRDDAIVYSETIERYYTVEADQVYVKAEEEYINDTRELV